MNYSGNMEIGFISDDFKKYLFSLEKPTEYCGTYVGKYEGILILADEGVDKGKAYLVDLSQTSVGPIGERKPNYVAFVNLK